MEILGQIVIALITTSLGSILAYFKAVKEANTKIEALRINADNEIKKIREESQKELDRIKTESEENIRAKLVESELELKKKEEALKYDIMAPFFQELMKNPRKAGDKIKELQDLANMLPQKK